MGTRGWLLFGGLLSLWLWPGCTTDHDALARDRERGGTSSGGSAGSGAGFPAFQGGSSPDGTGGRAPDEQPGESVLTIVNGVVDAPAVLLCFASGSSSEFIPQGDPTPSAGLPYAASWLVRALPGVDFEVDGVLPYVIAGDLELIAGQDCETALATAREEQAAGEPALDPSAGTSGAGGTGGAEGALPQEETPEAAAGAGGAATLPDPPRLRVAALPLIPAGTLSKARGRSLLMALSGCIGGPAFGGKTARAACGEEYAPRRPTLSAVLVPLARRPTFEKVTLQAVHASLASGPVEVRSGKEGPDEPALVIAGNLEYSGILPKSPKGDFTSTEYGANLGFYQVQLLQGSDVQFFETWRRIRERSGIEIVADSQNYTLVLLGPSFELNVDGFWNRPAIALVPSEP